MQVFFYLAVIDIYLLLSFFVFNTILFVLSVELKKQRKLQEGQLVLASPKHKYRERSCDRENESPITDDNKGRR